MPSTDALAENDGSPGRFRRSLMHATHILLGGNRPLRPNVLIHPGAVIRRPPHIQTGVETPWAWRA